MRNAVTFIVGGVVAWFLVSMTWAVFDVVAMWVVALAVVGVAVVAFRQRRPPGLAAGLAVSSVAVAAWCTALSDAGMP